MTDRIFGWLESPASSKVLGWGTLVLTFLVLVLAAGTIPGIRSDTAASRRTDELAACRSQYRSAVDEATVLVFDAYGNAHDAQGDVVDAQGRAAVAAIRQDPTTLALIAAEIESAVEIRREAVTLRQDAIAALYEANSIYDEAVALSGDDPDAFLAECRENGGG